MPIPGLRSSPERYPKIGDIRKGAKKTDPKKPGADLDFFRYAMIEGEEGAAAAFLSAYGSEPREIEILLPFDDIERVFDTYMERHTASALQCRGDIEGGWHHLRRREDGSMERGEWECPMPICEGCKETGRLKAIIPALRRLAYVEFHTTSIWDISELYGNLRGLLAAEGRLTGIPCIIKRRPRNISIPTKSGRMRKESWLLSIEAAPRYVDARLAEMEGQIVLKAGNGAPIPELPAGEVVVEATDEITEDGAPGLEEKSQSTNGKAKRPLTPAKLRKFLHKRAGEKPATWQDNPISAGQSGLIKGKLAECLGPGKKDEITQKRHSVHAWLWDGRDSSDDLTMAEGGATLDWLIDQSKEKEGTYDLHPSSAREVNAVLARALSDAGQQALPL